MATSRINVVADTNQAIAQFKRLEDQLTKINSKVSGLESAIRSIGLAAVIQNAIAFADSLQDLTDSTGLATANLLGFRNAVQASGGSIEGADKAVLKLVNTIGEAADGSASAQQTFAALGVNLKDLRTLSEQDILKKSIEGLGKITDKSEQARLKVALFGKEFRTVAVEDLAARYAKATAESVIYANSIKAAADAQGQLENAVNQFRLSLLEALRPLNNFIANLDEQKVRDAVDTLTKLAAATAGIILLASALQKLAQAITIVTTALLALGAFGKIAAVVAAGIALIVQQIERLTGVSVIDYLIKKYKELTAEESKAGAGRGGNPELTRQLQERGEALRREGEELRKVQDAEAKRRQEIQKASRDFANRNAEILDNINLEKSFVGQTQDFIEVEKAREEVLKRAAAESQKLRDAKAALSDSEKGLAAIYDQQIAKISQQAQVDADRVARATEGLQGLRLVEQSRQKDIENTTKAIEAQMQRQQKLGEIIRGAISQQQDAEFEGAQANRSPFERQMESIKENARKAALAAGMAFAETFEDSGDGLSVEQAAELAAGLEQIAQRYQQIAETQIANLNSSRTFAAGWKEAFDEYVDNATNAANVAKQAFQSLTSNMESALDTFVKTGKLNFGDFARSVIQDLLKIQLRAAAINMFKAVGSGNFLGSLFGFAKGGYISTNKPVLVGENGPELVSGAAGMTVTPNWKMNQGGGQSVTNNYYNISAVDAKGVAQLFAENRMTLLGTVRQAEKELPFRGR